MDPKVCGKLLTTHRRGLGDDVEALRDRFPLRRSADEGSKMGSRGYRRLRWWKLCFVCPWMFSGYVGIYRRKNCVGGRSWGPGDRGAPCRGGRALIYPGRLDCFLTCTPSPLDHVRSKNHAPEGFILFGLRLVFLFFQNTEIGKKQQYVLGLRLVG